MNTCYYPSIYAYVSQIALCLLNYIFSRCSIPVMRFAVGSRFLPFPLYAFMAWLLYVGKTFISKHSKESSYHISSQNLVLMSSLLHDRHISGVWIVQTGDQVCCRGYSLLWKRRLRNSSRADKHRTISPRQYCPPATQTALLPSATASRCDHCLLQPSTELEGTLKKPLFRPHNLDRTRGFQLPHINDSTWSRVLFQKLTVARLAKKLSALYENRRCITVFTKAQYWNLC